MTMNKSFSTLKCICTAAALAACIAATASNDGHAGFPSGMGPVDISSLKPLSEADSTVRGAVYADPSAPAADRAADVIRRMTFEEKLSFTGGWNRFMIPGIPRLGLRPVSMADASQGIRLKTALIKENTVSFPGMLPLASSWNPELAYRMSGCIAEECRALGVDLLLGPGTNIQRLSVGGRNFEYFGEDPYLTSVMATSYVKGLQEKGIIAVPKHFIGNDQEFCRHIANSVIDERTLREVYLLPWESLVKNAGVKGMMTGNNLVNGLPCSMHRPLIEDIMRSEYGFSGIAMTDWQNTVYHPDRQNLVLTSSMNLLMPDNSAFRKWITAEIQQSAERKNEIENLLEKMIFPTLYTLFMTGVYDRPFNDPSCLEKFESHRRTAAECASESIVLLKNDGGILPLKPGSRILLTGADEIHSGTGSGFVEGYSHVSYEQGLRDIYGDLLVCSQEPDEEAVKSADVVLFRLNKSSGEGRDIPFNEPEDQLSDLKHIAGLNDNVVVLVNACNTMPTGWTDDVKGIVWCYYLGQERGTAIADLLSGRRNFSGRLPFTIERDFSDSPAPDFNLIGGKPYWNGNNQYRKYWLGQEPDGPDGFSEYISPEQTIDVPYREGVFIGYRWYDRHDIPVVYPFGYGLSYTSFEYEPAGCDDRLSSEGKVYVTVRLRNTGKTAGKEVVQVYVQDPECSVGRPEKELKAFRKIDLQPGETKDVTLELEAKSFSFWDTESGAWKLEPGEFIILAGRSSADLPVKYSITVSDNDSYPPDRCPRR